MTPFFAVRFEQMNLRVLLLTLLPYLLFPVAPASASQPWQVGELRAWEGVGSDPLFMANLGQRTIFVADSSLGTELWVTDGTEAGTVILVDIQEGAGSGIERFAPHAILGQRMFFAANDGRHGREPWVTDGTAAGTRLIADLNPGFYSSEIEFVGSAGSYAYFRHHVYESGWELWRTDGTAAGTKLVKNLNPKPLLGSDPLPLGALGSAFIFSAWNGDSWGVYITNGSSADLLAPVQVSAGASTGDAVIFIESETSRIYKTNGTSAGTVFVHDGPPRDIDPSSVMTSGRVVYFAGSSNVPGELGAALWRTDGTGSGTGIVHHFENYFHNRGLGTAGANSDLFFGDGGLFRIDGSTGGKVRLTPERVGVTGIGFDGSRLFYTTAGDFPSELLVADASGANPRTVATFDWSGYSSSPARMFARNGSVMFLRLTPEEGVEPWVSDGTAEGTKLLKNINADRPASTWWGSMYGLGTRLVFAASGGLYASDRPFETFRTVSSTVPSSEWVMARGLLFYFAPAPDAEGEARLWRSDGTPEGTYPLAVAAREWGARMLEPTAAGVLFVGEDAAHGAEPWISDGTVEGTRLLVDAEPGPSGSMANYRSADSGSSAPDAGLGFFWVIDWDASRLWVTDGTPQNTRKVFEGSRSNPSAEGESIEPVGDAFVAVPKTHGAVFAIRNGGAEALIPWEDLGPDTRGYRLNGRIVVQSTKANAIPGKSGLAVWSTDGTVTGTRSIAEGVPLMCGEPVVVRGTPDLLFWMSDGYRKRTLWRTDGTVEGTGSIADFEANSPASFCAERLVAYGERVLFSAEDVAGNWNIWTSDGTVAGTRVERRLDRILSYGDEFSVGAVVGNLLFGTRLEAPAVKQLWAVPLDQLPGPRRRPVSRP